ncbi:threonine aldolase [Thermoleophilia bacterium SCSIO 60948]|nr:threonine aldolase [Thermoleophilia bacterium SCSIO 60948]
MESEATPGSEHATRVSDRAEPRGFASDNHAGAHPEVLAALNSANTGYASAYGDDAWTEAAREVFRDQLGPDAEAFFVFNGTAANVLSLEAVAPRSRQAVICAESAHLNVDEAGAPERHAGLKLLARPTPHGKLSVADIAHWDGNHGDVHRGQPIAVTITQSTELGTVYSLDEIRALADAAHERDMLLHIDGSRIGNAAASLGCTLRETTTDAGADVVSFGGTKSGMVFGEAVVFLRPGLSDLFEVGRKAGMQLASKMRFVAAQFEAMLGPSELWLLGATHANEMAGRLAAAVRDLDGLEITHPVEANAVFATLPQTAIDRLHSELGEHAFYVWDFDTREVRWMCSWETTAEDVDRFAERVAAALGQDG